MRSVARRVGACGRKSRDGLAENRKQPEKIIRLFPWLIYAAFFRRVLTNILVEILQVLAYGHHELVGVRAINNAVIVAHGKTDDVANGN